MGVKKVKVNGLMLMIFSLLNTTNSLALSQAPEKEPLHSASFLSSYVATLSLGPVWQEDSHSQTLELVPEILKTYTANNSNDALVDAQLFLGFYRQLHEKLQGQLGLSLAAVNDAIFSGEIWDDADPEFNNFTYRYKISHSHVALKGKLLTELSYHVQPWISGSVGVGFNRAHSFNNTPIIPEAVKMPNFSNHTDYSLSYTVGVGLQRALNKHLQLGVGYEFVDWGKSQLGTARGQTTRHGLSLSHVYTNGLLFELSYVA